MYTFKTKGGQTAIFRYPTLDDVQDMTDYINTLSQEDTFITFSGEQMSIEEEEKFVRSTINEIAKGNMIYLLCYIDGKLVGSSGIERYTGSRKRGLHVGVFGISIAKEYRGEGIGYEISTYVIEDAKKNMPELRIIRLHVYEPNLAGYNLYKKLGFKEYGRLPGGTLYRGNYVDEIEMYLPLS